MTDPALHLRLPNHNVVPPGGFYYVVEDTGARVPQTGYYTSLTETYSNVLKHYAANARLAPIDLLSRIEDFVCRKQAPGYCGYTATGGAGAPLLFLQVLQGTMTLGDWLLNGREFVSQEEANTRAAVCASCPRNTKTAECASCKEGLVREFIGHLVGVRSTSSDAVLKNCNICGCALKVKVWVPLTVLRRHIPPQQQAQYPPWCWLATMLSP